MSGMPVGPEPPLPFQRGGHRLDRVVFVKQKRQSPDLAVTIAQTETGGHR